MVGCGFMVDYVVNFGFGVDVDVVYGIVYYDDWCMCCKCVGE